MADVAREAGVTRTLVNHYFGGKRDLYLEVVRDAAASLPATVRENPDGLGQEELVERAVDLASDGTEGRDRKARGLANLARHFLEDRDDAEVLEEQA